MTAWSLLKRSLAEIIDILDQRFTTTLTEEARLFFAQIKQQTTAHPEATLLGQAKPFDNLQFSLRKQPD